MKKVLVFVALVLTATVARAQGWGIDATHSNVVFTVDHMVVSEVQGSFKLFDGKLNFSKPDMSDASIEFSIDINSINTDNDMRDKHLKSDDFFNAEKFPKATFKSKSITKVNDNTYKLVGYLTIRDITKEVHMDLKYGGEIKSPYGKMVRGFKGEFSVDRFEYNLKWSKLTELGGAVVGKDVKIRFNVEMVKN